jgi:hypothetical protein
MKGHSVYYNTNRISEPRRLFAKDKGYGLDKVKNMSSKTKNEYIEWMEEMWKGEEG